MIRASFEDARDRGEPLAALLASETPIYGRFGYGVATHEADLTIDRDHAALRAGPTSPAGCGSWMSRRPGRSSRRCTAPAPRARVSPVPSSGPIRCGTLYFHDPEHWRNGATRRMWAVYENGDGEARGYARYRVKEKWEQTPAPTTRCWSSASTRWTPRPMQRCTPSVSASIWCQRSRCTMRSVGEPDLRPARRPAPGQALVQRRVVGDGSSMCLPRSRPAATGWRTASSSRCRTTSARGTRAASCSTGGPEGADCAPTDAEPDLRIGAPIWPRPTSGTAAPGPGMGGEGPRHRRRRSIGPR